MAIVESSGEGEGHHRHRRHLGIQESIYSQSSPLRWKWEEDRLRLRVCRLRCWRRSLLPIRASAASTGSWSHQVDIGKLFKPQMFNERIMHECIKKLLSNVENPEKEKIESPRA